MSESEMCAKCFQRIDILKFVMLCCLYQLNQGVVGAYASKCEPIVAPMCVDHPNVWYNTTVYPNVINQTTPEEAVEEIANWSPLIGAGCSPQLRFFLCTVHQPICTILDTPIPPCRSLCLAAQSGCKSLMNFFGYPWPARLECDNFPVNGPCVSEHSIIGDLVDPHHVSLNITMNATDFQTHGSEGMPDFVKNLIVKFAVIAVGSLVGLAVGIYACVVLLRRCRKRQAHDAESPVKPKYAKVSNPLIYVPQPTAVHDALDEIESQKTQTNRSV